MKPAKVKFPLFPHRLWETPSWMTRALCGIEGFPDLWFPEQAGKPGFEVRRAQEICHRCPVRTQCLDYAMNHGEHGIWGGLTEQQRAERAGRKRPRRSYR